MSATCTTRKPLFHDLYGSYESCQAIHGSYLFDSIGQACRILDFACQEIQIVDFNVPPEISLSFFLLPAACRAVEKMTRNSEELKLYMAISLLSFLVSARFCFDTDSGYINISLIVVLNAKTQYRTIQGNSNN